MTKGFGKGASPRQGTVPQRLLLLRLKRLIDDASAKGAGTSRDVAKRELKELMRAEHWQTPYCLYNAGVTRCRYLRSLGYPVPTSYLFTDQKDIDRLEAWKERER